MAHVIPFHGTLYNPATVGDVRQVVAPPYDIIDSTLQKTLYDRHPNNVIRLELGYEQPGDTPANNKYTRAAGALKDWLKSGAPSCGLPGTYPPSCVATTLVLLLRIRPRGSTTGVDG